jgi:hypothetical protein
MGRPGVTVPWRPVHACGWRTISTMRVPGHQGGTAAGGTAVDCQSIADARWAPQPAARSLAGFRHVASAGGPSAWPSATQSPHTGLNQLFEAFIAAAALFGHLLTAYKGR